MAAADALAELRSADVAGVGADMAVVGVDLGAAEPTLVAHRQPRAIVELDREAVPLRRGGGGPVDEDPTRHPQVQPQRRPVVGLKP
jgi:hypothetical protein